MLGVVLEIKKKKYSCVTRVTAILQELSIIADAGKQSYMCADLVVKNI